MLDQELDHVTRDQWYQAAEYETGGYASDINALMADINALSRDDIYPYTLCPICGRPLILSCYASFTLEEYDPELYTVTVRGVDYCSECADELV